MPAQTTPDPAAIESEIEDLEARRNRLREKMGEIEDDLQDARTRLQEAEDGEAQDEALDRAERLQLQHDTVSEAVADVEADIEVLRGDLDEAKVAQEEEQRLEELAQLGREAIEARAAYDDVRDEIVKVLEERAPELANRFSEWLTAAEDFRGALVEVAPGVYDRSHTTEEDEAEAEALISELKGRDVQPFKDALAPHHTSIDVHKWRGWSYEDGYSVPVGPLREAVESIRQFGNQSAQSHE